MLDVGTADTLARREGDYDADGAVETHADELDGLLGRQVEVTVARDGDHWLVTAIDGLPYDARTAAS